MKILALNWDIVRISILCDLVKNQHNIFTYLNTDLWMKHNLGLSTDTDVWRWDLLLSLFGEGRGWVCSSWRHMTTLFRCDTAEQKGDLSAPESFVVRMLCWLSSTYDTRIKRAVVTPRRRERIQYGGDLQGLWLSGQKWRSAEKEEPEKDPHISLSNQGFITTEPILIFDFHTFFFWRACETWHLLLPWSSNWIYGGCWTIASGVGLGRVWHHVTAVVSLHSSDDVG